MRRGILGQEHIGWFVAAFVGGLLAAAAMLLLLRLFPEILPTRELPPPINSELPGLAYIDDFRCRPGLTKIVVLRGLEDDYSASGAEPASIRDAVFENGYFQSLAGQHNHPNVLRDYDQGGLDRHLIDHFQVPRGIVEGRLIFSARLLSNVPNDTVYLGDIDPRSETNSPSEVTVFYAPVGAFSPIESQSTLRYSGFHAFDFVELVPGKSNPMEASFLAFLNSESRSDAVDLVIAEDTQVDFAALLLCQEPGEDRGTAFREHRADYSKQGLSLLSCSEDSTQPSCNPFSGDQFCRVRTPISCYLDGQNTQAVEELDTSLPANSFVGGEVRLTRAIRGDRFTSLGEANDFCASELGADWRVLRFHEAGGHRVVSQSNIASGSLGLVHVGGQPYANCWDRPESVIGN
jgi:hypothetical protein